MMRLPLHWQILIGMIAGAIIGVTLNLGFSNLSVTIDDPARLPNGVVQAKIDESANATSIAYTTADGGQFSYRVVPSAAAGQMIRSMEELQAIDATAVRLHTEFGNSTAKWVGGWMQRIGGLFLRMLQMVAVPLIVTSLMTGIMGIAAGSGIARLFRRTLVYYLCTSMLAIATGLVVVNTIRPGLTGQAIGQPEDLSQPTPLGEVLFSQLETMIPKNPLGALAEPNFLSVIAFTIAMAMFAVAVGGETAERIHRFASDGFSVMMAMTSAIIALAPIGVFFLMASVTATQGSEVFVSLGWYVVSVASALAIHAFVTLPLILWLVARRNPLDFVRAMAPALLTAFSSASSNGTLPLTMSSVEHRAGVSNKTASFVLPLGATINMDGTALYEAVAVLFIAQLHFGQNMELSQQIVVALTALLASIGAAGIPHAGLVMMAIILHAVGLPLEMQGVILAVDRVLDMCRTSVNVWSDSCGCAVVEFLESRNRSAKESSVH
jgi:proton glutamate symport protein